jgi:large repetitive protein
MKKNSAFSLVELSVAMIIIGILIALIMGGGSLISMARLTNARSFTMQAPVAKIDGLVAWYETSSKDSFLIGEAINGNQVNEWHDISPNSIVSQRNTLTIDDGAVSYKADGIGKIPSLLFDGNSDFFLSNFYQGNSSQNTVFVVFKPSQTIDSNVIALLDSSSFDSSIGITSDQININGANNVSTSTGSNSANFISGGSYIIAAYLNYASSGAYANNASSLAGNENIDAGATSLDGLIVGAGNGGDNFNGLISEIIIYNRPLKLQERKDVMKYLSKKYQITVEEI